MCVCVGEWQAGRLAHPARPHSGDDLLFPEMKLLPQRKSARTPLSGAVRKRHAMARRQSRNTSVLGRPARYIVVGCPGTRLGRQGCVWC